MFTKFDKMLVPILAWVADQLTGVSVFIADKIPGVSVTDEAALSGFILASITAVWVYFQPNKA